MKKYLSIILLLFLFGFATSCSSDNEGIENTVEYSDLPVAAQELINKYFGGEENVEKVEEDQEKGITIFEVDLKDGYELVFNSMGVWQQISAPYSMTVPNDLIPEQVMQTLNDQFHGYGVIEINREGQNFHVLLSDNQGGPSIDLIFNQSGEILSNSMN